MPTLAGNGDGNGAQVLTGRVVHTARIALVFRAEHALGIAGLGGQLCRGDGLGVLFGLTEVDGHVQIAVLGGRLPAHVLLDAVAADVVGILRKIVVPVGGSLRAGSIHLSKGLVHFPGQRSQDAHEFGIKQVPAGNVIVADIPAHSVLQKTIQDLLQTHGFRVGRFKTVQLHGIQNLIGHINGIAGLNELLIQTILDQRSDINIYIHFCSSLSEVSRRPHCECSAHGNCLRPAHARFRS